MSRCGAVLIYVISLVALVAGLLALLVVDSAQNIRKVGQILQAADARYMAYSPINLTQFLLEYDMANTARDGFGDIWWRYREAQTFPIDGGEISLQIIDAGALPDLNSALIRIGQHNEYEPILHNYLEAHGINPGLLAAILDWQDSDNDARGFAGAESEFYQNRNPSYSTQGGWISSVGNLRLLKGYRREDAPRLRQFISLLPQKELVPVNINTIAPALLKRIVPEGARVDVFLKSRESKAYAALGDFYEDLATDEKVTALPLDVHSSYFTLKAKVTYAGATRQFEALFEKLNGKIRLRRVIWL